VIKNFLLKDDQLFSRHIFSRAAGDVIGKKGIVTLSRRIESAERRIARDSSWRSRYSVRLPLEERAVRSRIIYLCQNRARSIPGLVRIHFEKDENHHAGDRNVQPNGEGQACDPAVHREPARQREKECRQHQRQRDDGKDYVAG
jgi:hypothetical protein